MCENNWPTLPKFKAIVTIIRLVFLCILVVVKRLDVCMSCEQLKASSVSFDGCSNATDACRDTLPAHSISCKLCCMLTIYIYIYIYEPLLSACKTKTVFCYHQ